MRTLTRLATVSALATSALFGVSTAAHAEAAPGCADSYQIGTTGYINWGGQRAASVKQFWSPKCQANFAYVFVWQSFRDSHPGTWAVYVTEDIHGGEAGGERYYPPSRGSYFWSDPYPGLGVCSYALGNITYAGVQAEGFTDVRCG
ncbi:hypothetical protein Lfu02_28120 [Longispora fulva]|uniref:Secreted protein n=1 Tax=Longispora fulva TaxID=619741 RepID=A0A8J7KY81_9ACTN|nr:hypothetical protein [Longispora fulva]MBG6138947.1 hypothetical protein [Longispora fulva]GIG58440.1 hypothetical protein Lfu02_28120 [Longispora fulva]